VALPGSAPTVARADSVRAGSDRRSQARPLLLAVVVVAGALLMLLRRAGAVGAPSFWAEDGTIFYSGVLQGHGLFDQYMGQIWMLQRLAATAVGPLDLPTAAAAYYVVACVLAALMLAVLLGSRAEPVFGTLPWRIAGYFLLVLLPGAWEVHGNLANLHVWAAIAALICLSVASAQSLPGRVAEITFLVLACLSGFVAFVLLPVALWSLWRYRTRYARARAAVVCGFALIAVAVSAVVGRGVAAGPEESLRRLAQVPEMLVIRVGLTLVHGEAAARTAPWVLLAGLFVIGVVTLAVVDRRGPSPAWLLAGLAWVALGTVSLANYEAVGQLLLPYSGTRYFVLLTAATVLVLLRAAASHGRVVWRGLAVALLALSLVGVVADARLSLHRPLTQEEIDAFRLCMDTGPRPCPVPVRPDGW